MAGEAKPDVMTAEEVAERLGVHPQTVYRRAREGVWPFAIARVGREWRFSRARFNRFVGLEGE